MKNIKLLKFLLVCLSVVSIVACSNNGTSTVNKPSNNTTSENISNSTPSNERIDYVGMTKIQSKDWKTKSFMKDGVGAVTLHKHVDGDTAHFRDGNQVVQIRFNGVNTPESTGKIEPWGHAASKFTESNLKNAKTIIIETEPNNNNGGPVADSTGTRYLGWVWVSEKPIEEEDGSTLKLLNLMLIDGSYSSSKGLSNSVYSQIFIDCDLQAQKDNLRIWSDDQDPDFYYGGAIPTTIKEIHENPDFYLEGSKRIKIEGIVTRTLGLNAYVQEFYDSDETGESGTSGIYIFTQYRDYKKDKILVRGNKLRIIGKVSEYPAGSKHLQIVDVSYDRDFPDPELDMAVISRNNEFEAQELTPNQALNKTYFGTLVKFKDVKITGGYGGRKDPETTSDSNAMTLYAKGENGEDVTLRIDDSTFIKDEEGNTVETYQYFIGKEYAEVYGMVGYYETFSGKPVYQLMICSTSDLIEKTA